MFSVHERLLRAGKQPPVLL